MSESTRVSFFSSLLKNRTCFGLRRKEEDKTELQIDLQDLINKACCQISTDINGLQVTELKDRNKKSPDDFKEPLFNVGAALVFALAFIAMSIVMLGVGRPYFRMLESSKPRAPAQRKNYNNDLTIDSPGEINDSRSLVQGIDKDSFSQDRIRNRELESKSLTSNPNDSISTFSKHLNALSKYAMPGVIFINPQTNNNEMFGSGFIYREDGVIVTNEHVTRRSTNGKVKVTFLNGQVAEPQVSEWVMAIGNPGISGLSETSLGWTISVGVISSTKRRIPDIDVDVIQTDTAINPGNSGGALLNMKGEVIGMPQSKASGFDVNNLSFCIRGDTIYTYTEGVIAEKLNK